MLDLPSIRPRDMFPKKQGKQGETHLSALRAQDILPLGESSPERLDTGVRIALRVGVR